MQASQKVLQFAMQTADTGRDLQNVSKPKTQFFRKKCVSNYGGSVGDPNILMLDLSMALRAIVRRTVRVSILLCKMDPWRYAQSPKGRMHSLGDCVYHYKYLAINLKNTFLFTKKRGRILLYNIL